MGIGERRLYWEAGEYKKTFFILGNRKKNQFICVCVCGGGGGGNFKGTRTTIRLWLHSYKPIFFLLNFYMFQLHMYVER